MTTEEITIEEVKRLDAERTQGEWRVILGGTGIQMGMVGGFDLYKLPNSEANMSFIAAAPRIAALAIRQAEEIDQLRAENDRLRGALKFYGDEDNYVHDGNPQIVFSPIERDEGITAREALSQYHTPEKEDKTNGGWMPIETAPRDGTQLLLDIGYPWAVIGCWNESIKQWATAQQQCQPVNGVWNDFYYEYETEPEKTVKYWMPLPKTTIKDN